MVDYNLLGRELCGVMTDGQISRKLKGKWKVHHLCAMHGEVYEMVVAAAQMYVTETWAANKA